MIDFLDCAFGLTAIVFVLLAPRHDRTIRLERWMDGWEKAA
jgi:hypothetical protein